MANPSPLALRPVEALQRFSDLPAGESSPLVRLSGLRVTHRQRFGKGLQFVGLRCPHGTRVEMILKGGVFEPEAGAQLTSSCRLGDVVRATGWLEMSQGRLSIMAQRVSVEESWAAVFGESTFHDFWVEMPQVGNVLVQCGSSHASRLSDYLRATLGLETLALITPVSGRGGREERGLLLQAEDPASLFAALRADPNIARVVRRWYLLGERHATIEDAAASLTAQLLSQQDRRGEGRPGCGAAGAAEAEVATQPGADGAASRIPVRLHTFPRRLEQQLAPLLEVGGVARAQPRAEGAVLCVAFVHGAYAAGLASEATLACSGDLAAVARPAHGAVSRAYYKLQEAAARCELRLSPASVAIDVGASPGGWSVFLAGLCRKVVAVDPGQLRLPEGLACAARIEHMPMLLEKALPILRARGAAFDAYCCDMNAPPSVAVGLLLATLPLLRPGASIVLTFKGGAERKHAWQQVVDEQLTRLRAVAEEVQVLQLFANTNREATVVCRLAAPQVGARMRQCCRSAAELAPPQCVVC